MRAWLAPALLIATSAAAGPPALAVYPTDEGQDRLVALYGNQAVALEGCTGAAQARALLALSDTLQLAEQTQDALTEGFALGAAPRIPCAEADFALDWPAATGIWADPGGSGQYYLPMPGGAGYVAVPSRCTGLRTVFAIRARLQLPGVLRGTGLPPDLGDGPALVLDCGDAQPGQGTANPAAPQAAGAWSLHRFDTFLSEDSAGDTIPVLRFRADDTVPAAYLPVLRLDGLETRDTLLAGGAEAAQLEDALARLIGADPEAPVTPLGSEDVAALRATLYADLCLTACTDHAHRHAIFLAPESDLGVTPINPPIIGTRMDRLGSVAQVMAFAEDRSLALTGCDRLAQALGMAATADTDWQAAAAAVGEAAPATASFDCRASGPDLCLRRIAEGGTLTPAMLVPGPDCSGTTRLRIELPAALFLPAALHLSGPAFAQVELAPAPGVARSNLTVTPSRLAATDGSCVLAPVDALIAATGVPRLVLSGIDLRRAAIPEGEVAREAVGIQVQGGALILNGTTIDAPDQPLQRGVNLCLADLYATDSTIAAQATAVQALASRLLLTGRPDAPLRLVAGRFGLLLLPGTTARLAQAEIAAATPAVLRGAALEGASVALAPNDPAAPGSGMQLERSARADLTISRIAGFRCAVSFADASSTARLMLPGNDLALDNTRTACGPGLLEVLE